MTASNRKQRQAGLSLESAASLRGHQQECRSRRWPPRLSLRRWNAAVAATLITTSPVALPAFAAVLLVGLLPTSASAQSLDSPVLRVEQTASGELTATWSDVAGANEYDLRYRGRLAGNTWVTSNEHVTQVKPATSPYVITGLTRDNAENYDVIVYANPAPGSGRSRGISNTISDIRLEVPPATLAKPVVSLSLGNSELTASWDGVTFAASYGLLWRQKGETSWDPSDSGVTAIDPATSPQAITGLSNGTAYEVRVTARAKEVNSQLVSQPSNSEVVEGTPSSPPTSPSNLQLTPKDSSIEVFWTAATVAPNGYSVQWRKVSPAPAETNLSPLNKVGDNIFAITGLTNGFEYLVRVATRNLADSGIESGARITGRATPLVNTAPTVANAIPDRTATVGRSFSYTFPTNTFSDADGTTLTYTASRHISSSVIQALPTWLSFNASTRTFSGTPGSTDVDTVVVRVTATDTSAESVSDEFNITVQVAPEITDITDKDATFGTDLMVDVDATDSDAGDTLQYSASSSDMAVATVTPTTLTNLDANSQVTVTPVGEGTATITVTVSDGTAMPTDTFVVTVSKATLGTPTVTLDAGDEELTPNWAAVTGASTYELQYKQSTVTSWTATTGVMTVDPATSGTAITGLANGTAYDVRVRANAAMGSSTYDNSAWSAEVEGTPSATNVAPMITDITDKAATVGTDLMVDVDATDSDAGDTLQYSASSSNTAIATVSPTTLTNLDANSQVTVTPVGSGAATITVTVSDGTAMPTITFGVAVLRATLGTPTVTLDAGDEQLTPSWAAVTGASTYTLQYKQSTTSWTATTGVMTVDPATSGTAITGLANGTAYDVRVRANAAMGSSTYDNSAWSAEVEGTPSATNVAPMITDITDKAATVGTDLMVDVDATDSDAGDTLQYSASSSNTAIATVSPTTLTNLDANSQVTVTPVGSGAATITVTVSDGTAMPTITFGVAVLRATLGTPTVTLDAGDEQLTPSWAAVTGASTYTLQYKQSTTSWTATTGVMTVDPATSGTAITGLANGTAYDVRVRANAAMGSSTYDNSAWSAEVEGTPSATNVAPMITDITDKAATVGTDLMVDVDATDSDAGDTLQYSASSSDVTVATVSPTTLTNLDANSQVTVTPVGEGTATITVTVSDGTAMPTITFGVAVSRAQLPSAPSAPSLTMTASGQLTANWMAPMDDGGSGITDYDVRYRVKPTSGDPAWTLLDDTGVNAADMRTTTTIGGLINGTMYQVQVRAQNGNGEGAWSTSAEGTPSASNLVPTFGTMTIDDQIWVVGTSVDLTLPTATGGNGTLTYTLSPDLPTGVMLDATTRVVSGAPTAVASAATYTWTAMDSDANTADTDTVSLTFQVTVNKGILATPTGLALKANTQTQTGFTVSWTAVTNATSYTATATPSDGTPETGMVIGTEATFTGLEVNTTYTVSVVATDNTDNYNDSAAATLSQATAAMVTKEKLDEVNEEVAPSIINEVAARQTAIITNRFEIISSGLNRGDLSMEKVATDVADYLFSHHQEIQANGLDWRQALSGNNFSFALADTSVSQGSIGDQELSSFGPISFWGGIDYSSLEDKIKDFTLDGDITSFNFGVDKEFTSDLVLGILLSIANSEFELTEGSTDSTYEVDIFTLNPYISWQESENSSLWASVGYGWGQVDLTDDSTNPPVSERGNFTRFSAGGRFQLWQSEAGTALALKLDGTTAHFLGADVQRSRLATELSHDFSIESGVLNTALELGLLMSSADESAAELVGALHWQGDAGLSGSIRSRVLLGGGDRQEWGIGGALRYTAGGGEGLMMSLEPSFGISNAQLLPDLWQVTTSNPATTTAAPTAQLNAKLAYGFPTTGGLLTPYTDFSFSDTTSTYGAGLRYGLSTGLDLDLKGTHKNTTMDDVENSILLELRSDL